MVPRKQHLDQKINDSKLHIWSLAINFRFPCRKSQSQQKLAKKITHFSMHFRSKKAHLFYGPQLTYRKYTSAPKPKICLWLVSEKTFALHHFLKPKNCFIWWEGGGGGGVNNSLPTEWCLELAKCFKVFHFNWNFGNSAIF